jgi:DNA-binding HxlR family transcriptional regulator
MPTLTAAQRREAARAEYDAFLAACPSRQVLDRIGDKWVTLIMMALVGGPLRYRDLFRIIAGVSQKMLTAYDSRTTADRSPRHCLLRAQR